MKVNNSRDISPGNLIRSQKGKLSGKIGPKYSGLPGLPEKKEILSAMLENITRSMKSPRLMNSVRLKNLITPLNEVLQLLGQTSLEPTDSDVLLIEKFIGSWLKKYGEFLPEKNRRDLRELHNLILSGRMEYSENDTDHPLFSFRADGNGSFPHWKVSYRQRRIRDQQEEDEKASCTLELSTANIGHIKVLLSKNGEKMICLFQSRDRKVRQLIRKSLPLFRKQLQIREIIIPDISVSRLSDREADKLSGRPEGVNLWG